MKKKKYKSICPMCACMQNRTLSAKAAVEIHEFLEVIAENFMAVYGRTIYRHYEKRAKRNINVLEPWRGDCSDDQF